MIQVLILSADEAKRRRFADLLDAPDFQLSYRPVAEGNPLCVAAPDIVLADAPLGVVPWEAELQRGEIGVIALSPGAVGDVVLPADCTQRELRLACRLLAQIVRLRRLAHTDPLTGLANLRAWRDEWKRRLSQPLAAEPLCLALFDLDGFREVNKLRGHRAGDDLLKRLSQQLAQAIGPHDFVARLGGDEFGLLLSGVHSADALNVVQRMRGALAAPAEENSPGISASAGFVIIASNTKNIEREAELFDLAEAALRRAKRQGGNQTTNAHDSPP